MKLALQNGKALRLEGKATCACCPYQLVIIYDWAGTGMYDLDTKTEFLGEALGWSCTNLGNYARWISGDDTSQNGSERVDVRVDDARRDGLWTSSVNVGLHAGWYSPAHGSGPASVRATYRGVTQSKTISPGSQNNCASTRVGTIIVSSDGTFTLL